MIVSNKKNIKISPKKDKEQSKVKDIDNDKNENDSKSVYLKDKIKPVYAQEIYNNGNIIGWNHSLFKSVWINLYRTSLMISVISLIAAGFYSVIPSGVFAMPASMAPTFGKCLDGFKEIKVMGLINFIVVVVSFLFVDIFDTLGTLIGCAKAGGMLNEKGRLHNVKYALFSDAVGIFVPCTIC